MSSPSGPCRLSELRERVERLRALGEQDSARRHVDTAATPPPPDVTAAAEQCDCSAGAQEVGPR